MPERTVLITGGTGKLGRRLAEGFARQGWTVLFTSRSQARADALAAELGESTGGRLLGFEADLGSEAGLRALLEGLGERGLRPTCLVNNARDLGNLPVDDRGRPSVAGWQGEFFLSVVAPYELAMGLAGAEGSALGCVVNVSSMYGLVAANPRLYTDPVRQSPVHYGVCKAALNHLTRELAVRLADRGIRVNGVAYGGVEGRVDPAFLERYAALCPQGRMLSEDEVAGPALFLAGPGASAITGHVLAADGGWSTW